MNLTRPATVVVKALRQRRISPKLLGDLITSVLVFAVVYVGLDATDPTVAALIAKAAGFLVGFALGPGNVEVPVDAVIAARRRAARENLRGESGQILYGLLVALVIVVLIILLAGGL